MRIGHRFLLLVGGLALVALGGAGFATDSQNDLWLVPSPMALRPNAVATALAQLEDGKAELALPTLKKSAAETLVGRYIRVHQGQAELATADAASAAQSAAAVLRMEPEGFLRESALWLSADAAEARADWAGATRALADLVALPLRPSAEVQAYSRLGLAAQKSGQYDVATRAFLRVHDDFPASDEAMSALKGLRELSPSIRLVTAERASTSLGRAHALYTARKLSDARKAYQEIEKFTTAGDRDLVALRLAQIDAQQKRHTAALKALQVLTDNLSAPQVLRDEAEHTRLGVLRDLGRHTQYVAGVRAFVARAPASAFAEAALNDLGTHYILTDEDAKAADVFTEQYARFADGSFGSRAAWKAGWWAFANANYAETIRLFEDAAVRHRRADYRSGWVYWAARAHERLSERDLAVAGYQQTIRDYGTSYYGREAARALEHLLTASRPAGAGSIEAVEPGPELNPGQAPTNAALIQALLTAQLWSDAIGELRRTQRVDGNSPVIDATLAYALNRNGELRAAINAMKRAYPQYLADGHALPRDLLTVLFPVAHWELIQKYAKAHQLDPFLIAALVAQESTFDAKVRSSANAWGLMQILPSTGQRYARQLKIRPFSTARLTQPEINVRIGTTYFAELIKQFGDVAPALAAYNAGENRVTRWLAERPGLDRDEFVDGIPFPETQGYVRKILGTAEDYRLLYSSTLGR